MDGTTGERTAGLCVPGATNTGMGIPGRIWYHPSRSWLRFWGLGGNGEEQYG
jgi:hypothetical protein